MLPLHGGRAPKWLFPRMVKLSKLISDVIIHEYGESEFVSRLSNPYWFQALSCAIGYDWHSSGATTVTMGALKEALNNNSGIFIAGGKGKQGTATPEQIIQGLGYFSLDSKAEEYIYLSRMAAKIDSALVYDDIGIYHHTFVFSDKSDWCVVQQAMQNSTDNAIRFQIDSRKVDRSDITKETNSAVGSSIRSKTLDLTFKDNAGIKNDSVSAISEDINSILGFEGKAYRLPSRHEILENIDLSKRARDTLKYANELQPESYEELLSIKGMGRKTLKSLALISSLIYDKEISYRDPVMYAYNVGGKDGIPYPINLKEYDDVITKMSEVVKASEMNSSECAGSLSRLSADLARQYLANAK
ncbi:MAG: DUF763 domain-containing protein [Candidatus Micrarchaeaceae archaeon]